MFERKREGDLRMEKVAVKVMCAVGVMDTRTVREAEFWCIYGGG